jgi:hypothetical protein
MLVRLGHVLGWAGNLIAALLIVGNILFQLLSGYWEWQNFLFVLGLAALVFLIGRALRYIFAGPN